MKMEKRKFRIGELAEHLGVERFVIRFWEREFGIRSHRSEGGQRFYDERDLFKFKAIKQLLYDDGYTIAGAKKILKTLRPGKDIGTAIRLDDKTITPASVISQETTGEAPKAPASIEQQIVELHAKLVRLRELL